MIEGKRKKELTIENVLSKISEYDIFYYYMPNKNWRLNVVTNSPFRKDVNPSFLIGTKNTHISFIDFADTSLRGDCFTFVKLLYNLINIDEVLRTIDKDFGLGFCEKPIKDYTQIVKQYPQPDISSKKYSFIQVVPRSFTKEELAYWNSYHQDLQDLKDCNVYSIKKLYLNKQLCSLKETELRFGYFYDGCWKIYKPFADKKNKWVPNNVPITAMDGKQNIKNCKVAFINKSKKDWMVMKKIFECSCAVQNEGIGCFSVENVEYLKQNSERQILGFDSDITGVKNSQQITKLFEFDYCNVPKQYLSEGIKDFADLAKIHGLKTIENYLKQKKLL